MLAVNRSVDQYISILTGANAGGREDHELLKRRHFDLKKKSQFPQG